MLRPSRLHYPIELDDKRPLEPPAPLIHPPDPSPLYGQTRIGRLPARHASLKRSIKMWNNPLFVPRTYPDELETGDLPPVGPLMGSISIWKEPRHIRRSYLDELEAAGSPFVQPPLPARSRYGTTPAKTAALIRSNSKRVTTRPSRPAYPLDLVVVRCSSKTVALIQSTSKRATLRPSRQTYSLDFDAKRPTALPVALKRSNSMRNHPHLSRRTYLVELEACGSPPFPPTIIR